MSRVEKIQQVRPSGNRRSFVQKKFRSFGEEMVASYNKTLAIGHCQTLSRCTNSRSFGIHKDLRLRLRKRFYWPGLYRSVRNYVMHCKECQRRKRIPRKPPGHLMPMPAVEAPFHRVGVDLLGRFPKSLGGNK
ncbi:hypothetical protein AVEN_264572-1 [Araneus ventricosus]|uniref:Integrase zinc-binding domain-containing protein n=1 Tax=Araneus ventricosus TaxID=182803 RepID=A0A4Y2TLT9_ARAVE|nr:hypothetical protein AVEN_264572-1 [Araneus ventricosus]